MCWQRLKRNAILWSWTKDLLGAAKNEIEKLGAEVAEHDASFDSAGKLWAGGSQDSGLLPYHPLNERATI